MTIQRFFGEDGAFNEACEMYINHSLPMDLVIVSSTLGKSELAYRLGYCFGEALKRRGMVIADEGLNRVAKNKISYGDPQKFVEGFRHSQRGDE